MNPNRIAEADIVGFRMQYVKTSSDMPADHFKRPNWQRWVSFHIEPPSSFKVKTHIDQFNFTVSYSSVTDLRVPYAATFPNYLDISMGNEPIFSGRNKSIIWMVSHCNTISKRENYVEELKRYIDVDVIGKCGNEIHCPQTKKYDCEEKILPKYFFYLSFENSLCNDYITEKVWKRLRQGIVPIVLGKGNYLKELPLNSYIDVKDFKSPRHLADFLRKVMASKELYSSYHKWRKTQVISNPNLLCATCKFAYDTLGKQQVVPDVNQIWSNNSCSSPEQYYKDIFDLNV